MQLQDYAVDYGTVTIGFAPPAVVDDTPPPTLQQIKRFQDALMQAPGQIDFKPNHYFADGQYVRELYLEANKDLVGKMHRHEHLVTLVSGECIVVTTEGREHIVGPRTWTSPPGVKRVIRTLTDCHFLTFHLNPRNTRDLDAIEADVIVPEALIDYDGRTEAGPFANELMEVYA